LEHFHHDAVVIFSICDSVANAFWHGFCAQRIKRSSSNKLLVALVVAYYLCFTCSEFNGHSSEFETMCNYERFAGPKKKHFKLEAQGQAYLCQGTSYQCRDPDPWAGLPPKFNHLFVGPLSAFTENFM